MHASRWGGAVVLLGVAACATSPQPRSLGAPPAVETTQVDAREQTLSSLLLDVRTQVANPRSEPLTITQVRYEVAMGDEVVREGTADLSATVPGSASGEFAFPLAIERAFTREELAVIGETLRFFIKGEVSGSYGTAPVHFTFGRAAQFRAPRVPTVTLGTPDAARQRMDAIAVDFAVEIHNDNPFPIRVNGLDYVLEVEGTTMREGTMATREMVPASSSLTFSLPVDLTAQALPDLAARMREKNALDYGFRGTLKIGENRIPVDLASQIVFSAERR